MTNESACVARVLHHSILSMHRTHKLLHKRKKSIDGFDPILLRAYL